MTRSARYIVLHETEYTPCGVPVSLAQHLLHLMPRALPWQTVETAELTVDPDLARIQEGEDVFGNPVAWMALDTPHDGLLVRAESRVTVLGRTLPKAEASPPWESVREIFHYHSGARDADSLDAQRYLYSSPRAPRDARLAAFAAQAFKPGVPLLAGAQGLMEIIYKTFTFDAKATEVGTPVFEVLERRRGVCQDFAHLMIAALRSVGVPARYMSGYLLTDPPPGKPRLIGADASHAWVSVYCPGADGGDGAWIDADPTNGIFPDTGHITLGWGRDFLDISPLRGVLIGGGQQTMQVAVTVLPGEEARGLQLSI